MNRQLEYIGNRMMAKNKKVVSVLFDIVSRVYVNDKLRPIKFFVSKKDIIKRKGKIKSRY